ncbi:MAG: PLP-dependent transferase [Lachnospiraceae bacterium]|nr:PLP-dependent transferase [Lachnospiraceae bacterium]
METTITTRCIHPAASKRQDIYGAISYPIYQSATFAHPSFGESSGYDYSRMQNPTRERLEDVVCGLEGGVDCIALSSGMAAITTLFEIFSPGDHIIYDTDLYGGSIRLFQHINMKNGLTFTGINFSVDDVETYITPDTKALYLETPTNPTMRVSDLRMLSDVAKRYGLLLIVDNTFMSPYLQNPLLLGADVVVHSGTKYLAGHNDTICGFLVFANQSLAEKVRFIYKTTGAQLGAFDSWLVLRGIQTLAVRMKASEENTKAIAEFLQSHPRVKKVLYPGFYSHPGHNLMKSQARGFGSMISFYVEDAQLARDILGKTSLIRFAESLGGTETLLTYPITQTHADMTQEELAANGITDCLLRLSVGIEDAKDLISDLDEALK